MEASDLVYRLNEVVNNEVYFGPQGFIVFSSEDELKQGQTGFGIDDKGASLLGSNVGDWQINWVVIGSDTELGDPYFVDISEPNLSVYTAVHVNDAWESELVVAAIRYSIESASIKHLSNSGSSL